MAFRNIVTDAAGDSGNSASIRVPAGPGVLRITGDDYTGVTVKAQFSVDNSTFFNLDSQTFTADGAKLLHLPEGYLRVNITGGGAGDNIDANWHQSEFINNTVASAASTVRTNS